MVINIYLWGEEEFEYKGPVIDPDGLDDLELYSLVYLMRTERDSEFTCELSWSDAPPELIDRKIEAIGVLLSRLGFEPLTHHAHAPNEVVERWHKFAGLACRRLGWRSGFNDCGPVRYR